MGIIGGRLIMRQTAKIFQYQQIGIRAFLIALSFIALSGCNRYFSETRQNVVDTSATPDDRPYTGPSAGDIVSDQGSSIEVIAGAKTASVISANRTLDNFVSCLGVRTPNNEARAKYQEAYGTLSVEGAPDSVTAPMAKSLMGISAEVCGQLVEAERSIASTERRIFNSVDYTSSSEALNSSQIADITRRLARSCWGRNETSDELQLIQTNVSDAFGSGSTPIATQLTYVCTGVAASFSTWEM